MPIGNRSTFVKFVSSGKQGVIGVLKCECGREYEAIVKSAKHTNKTCQQCGASRVGKVSIKHGDANKTSLYRVWCHIKERCYKESCKEYKFYGALGVKMQAEWINDFSAFRGYIQTVLGEKPTPLHSLDRFPNMKGDYCIGNLRWADKKQQARNTKQSVFVVYNGERVNFLELAESLGLNSKVAREKYSRTKSLEYALKPQRKAPETVMVLNTQSGIYHESIGEASRLYGIPMTTLIRKLNNERFNNTNLIKV